METLNSVLFWISKNYIWIISLLIQCFIAYHVFFLTKKLSHRVKLQQKEKIKQKAEKLLLKIYKKESNGEVHLVNIRLCPKVTGNIKSMHRKLLI